MKAIIIVTLLISINGFGQKIGDISGWRKIDKVPKIAIKDTFKFSNDFKVIGGLNDDTAEILNTPYRLIFRGDSVMLFVSNSFDMIAASPVSEGIMHIPFTPLNGQTSFFHNTQSDSIKTDTVKGWIKYYKLCGRIGFTGHWWYSGDMASWVADTTEYVECTFERAIAIYDVTVEQLPHTTCLGCLDDLMVHVGEVKHLSKILVNGKPFDLSKHYEFLRDDEIVK